MTALEPNLIKLIDLICDGYSNGLPGGNWAPQSQPARTFCNFFVSSVCKGMGYGDFTADGTRPPLLANDMISFMVGSTRWSTIDGAQAQAAANKGALVIAGLRESGHGHVCMIRPGEMRMSGSWQKEVPRCANVGKEVFIDKSVNYAFRTEPTYFVLKEMLS